MLERGDVADGGEHRDVLEAYRMFAHDRGWLHRMREAVLTGLTAEAAVERVQSDTRARMLRQTDPYLRERLHDLDDLANRLMRQLMGVDHAPSRDQLPDNAILVARTMGPAALLDYDRKRLRGLVLEEGGPTSHVAIVARALGIPAVGEIANATGAGRAGRRHHRRRRLRRRSTSARRRISRRPMPSGCGCARAGRRNIRRCATSRASPRTARRSTCMINAGLLVDLPHIEDTGAAGIGLFRTELQFMVAPTFPRISEQLSLYRAVLDAAGDEAGDVPHPRYRRRQGAALYAAPVEEENPALGWRAIRLGLDRPGLLRSQIRALLRAGGGRALRIMFPMVAMVRRIRPGQGDGRARADPSAPARPCAAGTESRSAAMVEVPSLLFQLDELLSRVDFLSVGSNDLLQFLFAVDRGNARVADRFDPLSAPILRALRAIARQGP